MTLLQGKMGESYKVISINLEEKVTRHLQVLGMTEGTRVSILNSKKSGSMIIKIRETRFAIGKRFADGIEVGGAV